MNKLDVLYEDNHIIVVLKPANILSQGDITGDMDMLSLVKTYIKEKYHKPGNVYLGLVHRLDRPTSGIMVFARTSKAAARLSKQIQQHQFEKKYLAVVHGLFSQKIGIMKDYLSRQDVCSLIGDALTGKYAELSYQVLEENIEQHLSLVDISLKTGRHHQIRVQFSSRGFPLHGDSRYGKDRNKSLCLVAYSLSFFHPITKERLCFKIQPAKNMDGFCYFSI